MTDLELLRGALASVESLGAISELSRDAGHFATRIQESIARRDPAHTHEWWAAGKDAVYCFKCRQMNYEIGRALETPQAEKP